MPKITAPILFNTPEADAVLAAMQIFPKNNPWNEDISKLPVHRDSDKMIAQIGKDKKLAWNLDMGFIIVPPDQPKVDVKLVDYPGESDKGPFPMPDGAPIEGWPLEGGKLDDTPAQGRRRSPRPRRGPRQSEAVRVLPGSPHRQRLAGGLRGDVRPEQQRPASERMDLV